MSLNNRDWYRDAIRERDTRYGNGLEQSGNKSVRISDYSVKGTKAACLILLFLILFAVVTYGAAYIVSYPATVGFIAINVLIWILVNTHKMRVNQLGVSCMLVKRYKQWYRVISSEFTHENPMHILCNMYSLYNIGSVLEQMLGTVLFVIVYLLIGIAGGLISYAIHKKYEPNVISIGASGIICGLLGVYVVIAFHFTGIHAIMSVASSMVLLILMVFSKHIDSIGHFSGLATGVLAGIGIVKMFY